MSIFTNILTTAIFTTAIFIAGGACKQAGDNNNPGGSPGGGTTSSGTAPGDATLKKIEASSSMANTSAANLMDGGNAAWCEGKSDHGLGESFTLTFDESVSLKTFRVRNGIGDPKLYSANNRVKKLLINGVKVKLSDSADFQTVTLPQAAAGESIKFVIGSVHQGAKNRNTCIAEIAIEGVKAPAAGDPKVNPPTTTTGKTDDPNKNKPAPPGPGKDLPPPPAPGE